MAILVFVDLINCLNPLCDVVQDVYMPVMDGLQATRLIRSFEEHGCWDASVVIRDEQATTRSDLSPYYPAAGQCRKRIPIIAVHLDFFLLYCY